MIRRAAAVAYEEVRGVRPRLSLGLALAAALPQNQLARSRAAILRFAGLRIGAGTVVGGRVSVVGSSDPRRNLEIGSRCFVNSGCHFDASAPLVLGDRVSLAQDVLIVTESHDVGSAECRAGVRVAAPVTIGDGCWIGARATILPGVSVSAGSVIAAGAVVAHDVAPNTLVAGVPAKLVRPL